MANREGTLKLSTRKSGDLPTTAKLETGLTEGDMTTTTLQNSKVISTRLAAGLMCLFMGAGLIFAVGLSNISAAHNAAHDTRHSIGFPCH
jgi:cobalt transporter subunit CbtB